MKGFACMVQDGCVHKGLCQDVEHCIEGVPEGPALNVRAKKCSLGSGCALPSQKLCDEECYYHVPPEEPKDAANPKDALGASKPSMGLIPVGAMEAVARVMELGAKKYGPYNWRSKAVKKMVYANAALRHLFAWIGGQDKDPESGQSHMAHVAACMLLVLDAETQGKAIDDREWVK
jgi:hypothetical protein